MSRRVLVVDDDFLIVESLCDILELHGWKTFRAHDGGQAAELVAEEDIGLVIMDVRMPRVDGVEGLRRIKERRPGTRVILMTAYAAQDLLARAEEEGALHVLRKPVAPDSVVEILEDAAAAAPPSPVLVVDDNPAYLDSLCDALSLRGLDTVRARGLDEAVAILSGGEPAAILLDLKLDHIDPERVLLAIRGISPSVLLILYSGHEAELSDAVEGKHGQLVDAAFRKPLDIDRLVEFVNAAER